MQRPTISTIAVLTCLDLTHASAGPCLRWTNLLSEQDFGVTAGASEQQLSGARRAMYSDTKEEACTKFFKKLHPAGIGDITIDWVSEDDLQATCSTPTLPCGQQPQPIAGNCVAQTNVFKGTVPRQPCCSAQVRGPYWDITNPPYRATPDRQFSGTPSRPAQKQAIKARNPQLHGEVDQLRSDAPSDPYRYLQFDSSELFRPDDDSTWPFYYNRSAAQVDHIVPRTDINGCDCGTNEYKNALLISAELNNSMKNYCDHPTRQKILNDNRWPRP